MKPPSLAPLRSKTLAKTDPRVKNCQRIIGYRFRNPKLIREALTPNGSHNQRLALVGDTVADLQVAARWYGSKARLTPLQFEIIKNALLSNNNLAIVGSRLRIQDCTLSWCGTGRRLANTVEAIIGAVWLDSKRDFAAVGAVMDRLGLARHALLPSPSPFPSTKATNQPRYDTRSSHLLIPSSRSLPDRFFVGHHLGLFQLLFQHSQSFMLRQRAGPHGNLSPGMRSRFKPILLAPKATVDTAQKRIAARVGGKGERHGQELSPCHTTKLQEQQAPAHVLATKEQTNADNDDYALGSRDTERKRIDCFIHYAIQDKSRSFADRRILLKRLGRHRDVLDKLPGRSLKNLPEGFPTDGVYLTTHAADEFADRSMARQIAVLYGLRRLLRRRRMGHQLQPEEKSNLRLVERQLAEAWNARLLLWLPQDAQDSQAPTSLPESGQESASDSSETPGSGSPVSAAVDSTRKLTLSLPEDQRPHRPGPVLWTTPTGQQMSVDWKQYLRKPTSENK